MVDQQVQLVLRVVQDQHGRLEALEQLDRVVQLEESDLLELRVLQVELEQLELPALMVGLVQRA